jgi:NADH-quinone oxidoreductase subunit H
MEVGPKGILQTIADLLKMLQKEDIRPHAIDKIPFKLAPFIVFAAVFAGFSLVPLNESLAGSSAHSGLFLLMAIVSLDVFGILMAGWSSNNKYSLYGAMRSVAQIISYEIPLGLSILSVVIITGTLDLQETCFQQSGNGLLGWNILKHPVLIVSFFIFFIAGLAESNRSPFDLPEAESELVGGYHTEYSGFRWGIFMLSEYGMMLLISILGVILFFGGWNSPLPNLGSVNFYDLTSGFYWGAFWLLSKSVFFVLVQMWVRWTLPRLRVDQLMAVSWKYLTPLALLMLFIVGLWKIWLLS